MAFADFTIYMSSTPTYAISSSGAIEGTNSLRVDTNASEKGIIVYTADRGVSMGRIQTMMQINDTSSFFCGMHACITNTDPFNSASRAYGLVVDGSNLSLGRWATGFTSHTSLLVVAHGTDFTTGARAIQLEWAINFPASGKNYLAVYAGTSIAALALKGVFIDSAGLITSTAGEGLSVESATGTARNVVYDETKLIRYS